MLWPNMTCDQRGDVQVWCHDVTSSSNMTVYSECTGKRS